MAEEPEGEDMEVAGDSLGNVPAPTDSPLTSAQTMNSTGPPPLIHIHYYGSHHAQGIYQLIEAYMLSLQTGPLADDLKQQVAAVTGEGTTEEVAEGEETVMETTPQITPICAKEEGREEAEEGREEAEAKEEEEEEEPLGEVEYYVDYCVDKYALGYKSQVLFEQVYTEPFWVDRFVEKEERRLRRMAIKCFNCGEDHHINQCPEPKDPQRILNESRLFKESLGTAGADKRYHLSAGVDRFSKFSPGQISARLRLALGIGPSALPPYIPRMCQLGYPPGYKLQAEEEGLVLYHSPEEGDTLKHEHKVIIYPGFNNKEDTSKPAKPEDKDSKPVAKEQESVGEVLEKAGRVEEDDLGSMSDYELEELEDGDDGEMVVGFRVKSTLNAQETSPQGASEATEKGASARSKNFSLDFPPGLVDVNSKEKPSSHKWNAIKKLLFSRT